MLAVSENRVGCRYETSQLLSLKCDMGIFTFPGYCPGQSSSGLPNKHLGAEWRHFPPVKPQSIVPRPPLSNQTLHGRPQLSRPARPCTAKDACRTVCTHLHASVRCCPSMPRHTADVSGVSVSCAHLHAAGACQFPFAMPFKTLFPRHAIRCIISNHCCPLNLL